MKQYILLTESGSDLSPEIAKGYGIKIIPMHVQFDGKIYADGDILPEEFFEKSDLFPTTSAPNPADFELVYRQIREENPDSIIIHIAYSAQTTCSYQNSIIAETGYDNIYHVDCEHVSAGLGAIAIQAARYLKAHPDIEPTELIDEIKKISNHMKFQFVVKNMNYLKAGGRCSNAQYLMAQILDIKPLIEMKNGLLVATKKYRGKMERVSEKMINDFFSSADINTDEIYFVYTHGLSKEIRENIEQKCRHDYHVNRIVWFKAGCIISAHGGPSGLGIGGLSL